MSITTKEDSDNLAEFMKKHKVLPKQITLNYDAYERLVDLAFRGQQAIQELENLKNAFDDNNEDFKAAQNHVGIIAQEPPEQTEGEPKKVEVDYNGLPGHKSASEAPDSEEETPKEEKPKRTFDTASKKKQAQKTDPNAKANLVTANALKTGFGIISRGNRKFDRWLKHGISETSGLVCPSHNWVLSFIRSNPNTTIHDIHLACEGAFKVLGDKANIGNSCKTLEKDNRITIGSKIGNRGRSVNTFKAILGAQKDPTKPVRPIATAKKHPKKEDMKPTVTKDDRKVFTTEQRLAFAKSIGCKSIDAAIQKLGGTWAFEKELEKKYG